MSDQAWQYLLALIGASAGMMARVGKWRKEDGTFDGWKALAECMSIPAITILVVATVSYFKPDLSGPGVAGLGALVAIGSVGFIEDKLNRWANKKIDG